jgi:hypothetical protein
MFNRYTLFLIIFTFVLTGAGCSVIDVSFSDDTKDDTTTTEVDVITEDQDIPSGATVEDFMVPEDLVSVVNTPTDVAVGDQFDITITITNNTEEDHFLHSIDVSGEYLDAFTVLSIDPPITKTYPLNDGTVSHFLEIDVPANEERVVTFSMEAPNTGDFDGDLDVCFMEGLNCSYLQIHTVVE